MADEAAREGWRLATQAQNGSNRMRGSCYPLNPTRLTGAYAPVFFAFLQTKRPFTAVNGTGAVSNLRYHAFSQNTGIY